MTNGLATLDNGAILQIRKPWDTYTYKGSGVFIAAGSGITPFVPILNELVSSGTILKVHTLIYTNKRKEDILFQSELKRLLGKNYINILSTVKERNIASGRIDLHFLKNRIKNLNHRCPVKNILIAKTPFIERS